MTMMQRDDEEERGEEEQGRGRARGRHRRRRLVWRTARLGRLYLYPPTPRAGRRTCAREGVERVRGLQRREGEMWGGLFFRLGLGTLEREYQSLMD